MATAAERKAMTDNLYYWKKRENDMRAAMDKSEAAVMKKIKENTTKAMDDIRTNIEGFYTRYAEKEGITLSEAMKRADRFDVKKYQQEVKDILEKKSLSTRELEELRLYNVTMRVNRLEALNKQNELALLEMNYGNVTEAEKELIQFQLEEHRNQAGILGMTTHDSTNRAASIVNSSFLNATYDERIWGHTKALQSTLETLLLRGVTQGTGPLALMSDLRKAFEVTEFEARRLLVTEMARVSADTFKDNLEEYDYSEYVYQAEPTACEVCSALDGLVFKVKDMSPGVNMYPMHPFCKCFTAPYIDEEAFYKWLDEVDPPNTEEE